MAATRHQGRATTTSRARAHTDRTCTRTSTLSPSLVSGLKHLTLRVEVPIKRNTQRGTGQGIDRPQDLNNRNPRHKTKNPYRRGSTSNKTYFQQEESREDRVLGPIS